MKAILFQKGKVEMLERDLPRPGQDEALVKTLMAGICRTDIELYHGYQEFEGIAGHEFVGRVETAPAQQEYVGQRVVADINRGCGECSRCLCADARHCPDRRVLGIKGWDGAFAEYLVVPVNNLHILDPSLSLRKAVFAEPLAAALEISQQIHITHSTKVAVLGDGKLGLLVAAGLRHFSSHVTLLGRHRRKLDIAAFHGVQTLLVSREESADELVEKIGKFQVVVEATARKEGLGTALKIAEAEGTVVVKTTLHQPSELDVSIITVNELNLLGSRCGDLDLALDFLKHNRVEVERLIEKQYPFEHFHQAFEHAKRRDAGKILLYFQ